MNNRRKFLQTSSLVTTGILLGKPLKTFAGITRTAGTLPNSISVLYTADLHGRIGSFSTGNLNNIGGLNNIYSTIRKNGISQLLLDGGDFLDKGDVEDHSRMIAMMNKTGYQAATPGDKEFCNGQDYLARLLPLMNFKLVNCNYEFSNPVLKTNILKFHIIQHNRYKVGITGVGPRVRGAFAAGIEWHHPYTVATEVATLLKKKLNCDIVICLSHLGLEEEIEGPGNRKFAASSKNIDVIIGGHNNTIAQPQIVLRNSEKNQVIIANAAHGGSIIGSLNFGFNEQRQMHLFTCKNFIPGAMEQSSFYAGYQDLVA